MEKAGGRIRNHPYHIPVTNHGTSPSTGSDGQTTSTPPPPGTVQETAGGARSRGRPKKNLAPKTPISSSDTSGPTSDVRFIPGPPPPELPAPDLGRASPDFYKGRKKAPLLDEDGLPEKERRAEYDDVTPQKGSQLKMLTSPATEIFMGGEAGGGKSYGFLLDFLGDADKGGANGLFLRRHFTDLEGIIHDAQQLYKGYGATFNEQKHTFYFPSGARLRMAHMNSPADVYNYTGNQRTHYYWDELTQFPRMPYVMLMAWLRSTDTTIFKRIRASGNPDGEGFLWVKDRFIDRLEPFEMAWFKNVNDRDTKVAPGQSTAGAMLRQFIPCYREENKKLMEADPEYRDRLEQLPEHKKRAYKYGIWDSSDRPFQVVRTRDWVGAVSGKNARRMGMYGIGADYAESGDKCAMCIGMGNQVTSFKEWNGMETHAFASIILKAALDFKNILGPRHITIGVDSIGPGTGVYHALKKSNPGYRIDPMRYKDPSYDREANNNPRKIKFNNLRSQMWWKFKEDTEKGLVDLSHLQSETGFYDNLYLLQEEVLIHTFEEVNGVIKIIDKNTLRDADHLGRSPDRADALVIWNWVRDRHREPVAAAAKVDTHFNPEFNKNRDQMRRRLFSAGDADVGFDEERMNDWQGL